MTRSDKEDVEPPMSRNLKLCTTFVICLGNLCMTGATSTYGPSLVEFKNKYGTSLDEISLVVTISTLGYLSGSLSTVIAYKYIRRQVGVLVLMGGAGVAMYLTPHCPSRESLFCVGGLLGFCFGGYDASQMVWVMEMWQKEAGPFIQAQQFSYALGIFFSSLLIAPFLGQTVGADPLSPNPRLFIPFTIIGGLLSLALCCQMALLLFGPYRPPPPEEGRMEPTKGGAEAELGLGTLAPKRDYGRLKLILLSAIFMGADQGMEICTFSFLSTFAQYGGLQLSASQGAYLLSGINGALIGGRGLGILAVLRIRPQFILCVNLVLLVVCNGTLALWGGSSLTLLWAGAVGLGLGFSTMAPCYLAYIERHLLFTNGVGSIMLIAGSSVGAIYPLIVGKYMAETPRVLTYTNFFSIGCILLAAGFIVKLTFKKNKNLTK